MGCISQCYVLNGEEERLPLQPEGYAPEDRGNMCCIKKSLNVSSTPRSESINNFSQMILLCRIQDPGSKW